jgi:hypothetical protein
MFEATACYYLYGEYVYCKILYISIIVGYIYLGYFMNKLLNFLYPILVTISFPAPTCFPFPVILVLMLFVLSIVYTKRSALYS